MTRRGKAYAIGSSVALLLLIGFAASAKADDKKDDDKDACPDGMQRNPAIVQLTAQLAAASPQQRAMLQALLAQALANPCVPIVCPDDHHRTSFGTCAKNTPEDPDPGFDPYDPGADNHTCPEGQRWSPHGGEDGRGGCVPICGPDEFFDKKSGSCLPKPPGGGDIDDILKPVPVPGAFYQVRKGDIFLGQKISDGSSALSICYMALRRAGFEAAKLYGDNLSDQAAWNVVKQHASLLKHEIKSLRPYLEVLQCGWWNDEVNASWKFAGNGQAIQAPTGRAISLNPVSAPNLDIMRAGGAPARNVRLGTPAQKNTGAPTIANGSWRFYPLIWIPEIDLKQFWDSGFNTITAEGITYDDGSSRANPPPWITIRGVDDATGTLQQGTVMGCGPSQKVVG